MYSLKKLYSGRKLHMRLAFVGASVVSVLAVSATSALAVEYDNGNGSFHAAAHINLPPPPLGQPCATYSLYNAHLTFPGGTTVTASSDPKPTSSNFQWGEFGDGTHHPQTSATGTTACTDNPGQVEAGFTGTLTNTSPAGVCTLSGGTYKRGGQPAPPTPIPTTPPYYKPELNVEYNFTGVATVAGTCPAGPVNVEATIPSVDLPPPGIDIGPFIHLDSLSACNSSIAPTSCVLGPAATTPPNGPF